MVDDSDSVADSIFGTNLLAKNFGFVLDFLVGNSCIDCFREAVDAELLMLNRLRCNPQVKKKLSPDRLVFKMSDNCVSLSLLLPFSLFSIFHVTWK